MSLRVAEEITIKPVANHPENSIPASDIYIRGEPVGKKVSGALLQAAVKWHDKYLLLTTDACPFEEGLGIRLFNSRFDLLDCADIGLPYNTGTFSSLELHEPNRVSFRFLGDDVWQVHLLSRPGFRVPILSEPGAVWRNFGFRRHFFVRKVASSG